MPADLVYGPPPASGATAGAPPAVAPTARRRSAPAPPLRDTAAPAIKVSVVPRIRRANLLTRGLEVRVRVSEAASVAVVFNSQDLVKRRRPGDAVARAVTVALARVSASTRAAGARSRSGSSSAPPRASSCGASASAVKARVLVTARDAAGNDRTVVKTITIGRVI